MSAARLRSLKGDRRTLEHREWTRWLRQAAALVRRFDQELGDDPFAYNETASVSLLASAAARAGYLGLAEFGVTKRSALDLRRHANGRCDLWVQGTDRNWGFEFKQAGPFRVTETSLDTCRSEALSCARCLRHTEADVRVGAVIVNLMWLEDEAIDDAAALVRRVAKDADFAFELTRGDDSAATFLLFDLVG